MNDTHSPRPDALAAFVEPDPPSPGQGARGGARRPVHTGRFPPWPAGDDDLFDPLAQEPPMPSSPSPPSGSGTLPPSLFTRVGGPATLRAVVEIFYDRVLADPSLAPYFRGVDDRRLRSHQRWFLGAVLGGPDTYTGRDLAAAHAGLGITETAFDLVAGHLLTAFEDFGTTANDRGEIASVLTTYRAMIVDGGTP